MNKQTEESKISELISFLSNLIQETIYPYGHQAPGLYKAKNLNQEIHDCFHNAITEIEKFNDKQNNYLRSEIMLQDTSQKICLMISTDLEKYFLEKSGNRIFLLDYKIFAKDVFNKIQQILF
jgi:hypothetical protein